jgi:hypothetical protein
MDRALQFYRRTIFNRTYAPHAKDSDEVIRERYEDYVSQLHDFKLAYRPILSSAISEDDTILNPAALVLTLYHASTLITLSAVLTTSENIYDSHLPLFRSIVSTASMLINSYETSQLPRNQRFTFDIGIVPPLHVTATKCREPRVRREAVELLFASPRQEGMWDGVLCARIGKWIVKVEEELGLGDDSEVGSDESVHARDHGNMPSFHAPVAGVGGIFENGNRDGRGRMEGINWMGNGENIYGLRYLNGSSRSYNINLPSDHQNPNLNRNSNGNGSWNGNGNGCNGNGSGDWKGNKRWVPEEKRVRLMIVDFHTPERYIRVKCQRAMKNADGTREERETVIAW